MSSFVGLTNVYYNHFVKRNDPVTPNLEGLIGGLSEYCKSKSQSSAEKAVKCLCNLSASLKQCSYPNYTGKNEEVRNLFAEGRNVFNVFSSDMNDKKVLAETLEKIRQVVLTHFEDPARVKQTLLAESVRQGKLIREDKLYEGICGVFEIANSRPALRQIVNNKDGINDFIPNLSSDLNVVIKSFTCSKTDVIQRGQGLPAFKQFVKAIALNKDGLLELCENDSQVRKFINELASIKDDQLEKYYDALKDAVRSCCGLAGANGEAILSAVRERAKEINSGVSRKLKGEEGLGERLASAFKKHKDHGPEESPNGDLEQLATGIKNAMNCAQNEKMRAKIKDIGEKVEKAFYEDHTLYPTQIVMDVDSSDVEERPFPNEFAQALACTKRIIESKLEKHQRENGYLLGLPKSEIQRLKPQFCSEIIEFGREHNMFSEGQLRILAAYWFALLADQPMPDNPSQGSATEEKKQNG